MHCFFCLNIVQYCHTVIQEEYHSPSREPRTSRYTRRRCRRAYYRSFRCAQRALNCTVHGWVVTLPTPGGQQQDGYHLVGKIQSKPTLSTRRGPRKLQHNTKTHARTHTHAMNALPRKEHHSLYNLRAHKKGTIQAFTCMPHNTPQQWITSKL